jgi:Tfp pilus assembly protein PilX
MITWRDVLIRHIDRCEERNMTKIQSLRGRISAKLRSDRGASLSFALLLFLVCTVIGSVVLAAGTASAGRMSQLGESDQRYYSVASAAQLLAKELTNKEVRIIRKCVETKTTPYKIQDDAETLVSNGSATTAYEYTTTLQKKGEGDNYSDITTPKTTHYAEDAEKPGVPFYDAGTVGSFLSERAVHLLFGPDGTCSNPDAMGKSFSSSTTVEDGSFTMEHEVYGDILKITGKYRMTANGTIVLTLWDKDGKDQSFSLVLTLQPEFVENTTTYSETKPPKPVGPESKDYTSEETKTTVKESTATWKLGSITKNSVAYSGS